MYRWGFGSFAPPPAPIASVLQNASASSGVPVPILQALAYQESSYNPAAVSPKGAQGLLQLMPATGRSLGVSNPFDPQQNADAGAKYLAGLYQQYGDWGQALIAYNEGPGNLAKSGVFRSSQSYADTILANAGPLDSSPSLDTSGASAIDSSVSQADVGAGFLAIPDISSISPIWIGAGLGGLGLLLWAVKR